MTWKTLTTIIGRVNDKSNLVSVFKINNVQVTDNTTISNGFCDFFAEIGKTYSDKIGRANKSSLDYLGNNRNKQTIFLSPTDPNEIHKIVTSLKTKNSSGHDGFSTKFIKHIITSISEPLTLIANKSMEEGLVPTDMKLAKVVPIFKSKDSKLFNNYRPISLLPSISKIMEKIMHRRLYHFLQLHNLLYTEQFGFT